MKKNLDIATMEQLNGGNAGDAFCAGFAAGSIVYGVGVLANWWNPVGWAGSVALLTINAGCAIYASR
jgi:hypothetical protein